MRTNSNVVCTGMGVIAPFASGIDEFHQALAGMGRGAGKEFAEMSCQIDGELFANVRGSKYFDKCTKLLYAAVAQFVGAMDGEDDHAWDTAISVGTAYSSLTDFVDFLLSFEDGGLRGINPILFPNTVHNCPASQLAILLKVSGPNLTITNGLAAGLDALAAGIELARTGRASRVIVGGVDENSAYLRNGIAACLPQCPGAALDIMEAAGALFIEQEESALRRKAPILGRIPGYAQAFHSGDMKASEPLSAVIEATMRNAVADAGLNIEDIDSYSVSVNGLPSLDEAEFGAVGRLLRQTRTPKTVIPLKRIIGESGGAAGLLQLIVAFAGPGQSATSRWNALLPGAFVDEYADRLTGSGNGRYVLANNISWQGHVTSMVVERLR